jgi:hypothetical protein
MNGSVKMNSHRDICPNDDVFVRAFMNKLSLANKDELVSHVLKCPRCRLKFQTMKQVQAQLKKSKPPRGRFWVSTAFLKYAGVASGIITVLLAMALLVPKLKRDGIIRGGATERLTLLEPASKIPIAPSLFIWTPVRNADSYSFWLIDDELNTVLKTDSRATQLRLPVEISAKLVKGKTYVWTIE